MSSPRELHSQLPFSTTQPNSTLYLFLRYLIENFGTLLYRTSICCMEPWIYRIKLSGMYLSKFRYIVLKFQYIVSNALCPSIARCPRIFCADAERKISTYRIPTSHRTRLSYRTRFLIRYPSLAPTLSLSTRPSWPNRSVRTLRVATFGADAERKASTDGMSHRTRIDLILPFTDISYRPQFSFDIHRYRPCYSCHLLTRPDGRSDGR